MGPIGSPKGDRHPGQCVLPGGRAAAEVGGKHPGEQGRPPLILNWSRAKKQFNNGIVEGLNLKWNLTVRKAFGFRTFKALQIASFHQLGDLPEPHSPTNSTDEPFSLPAYCRGSTGEDLLSCQNEK